MDKELLAAFADGDLSPEEAARVVMHLADHPEDQAWVDDLMAANVALVQAFSAPMSEPVPDRLRDLVMPREDAPQPAQGGRVVAFRPRRAPVWAGIGAALAAVFVGALVLMPSAPVDRTLSAGAVAPDSELRRVLDSQPSGQRVDFGGADLTVLATLPALGGFCREVELLNRDSGWVQVALACRNDRGWNVDVAMSETLIPVIEGQDFLPASGKESVLLDYWLERRGAGMTLTPAEEAAAITAGWSR